MCTSYSNLKPHWERNRKDHCVGYELQLPTLYALIRAGACCESGSARRLRRGRLSTNYCISIHYSRPQGAASCQGSVDRIVGCRLASFLARQQRHVPAYLRQSSAPDLMLVIF